MGKLGRFACILTPMVCTLISLLAVIVLLLAGTKKSIMPGTYLVRLDVRHINPDSMEGTSSDDLGLKDFYSSYMWNYCEGSVEDDKKWKTDDCKSPKSGYALDLDAIIDEESERSVDLPDRVDKAEKAIKVVSRFMGACYVLGAIATAVTFFVGWFGLLSRWGSCVTTIFANVACGFLLTASICATVLTYSIKGAFDKAFSSFGVDAIVGKQWMTTTWVCTAFAFAASVFWLMSTCCCSGRTRSVMGEKGKGKTRGTKVEHTGGYERVSSPYPGGSQVPLQPYGAAPGYEPMRHAHA